MKFWITDNLLKKKKDCVDRMNTTHYTRLHSFWINYIKCSKKRDWKEHREPLMICCTFTV